MLAFLKKIKERVEAFLNEKNFVTDCLNKIEEKTGIKKRYLAIGNNNPLSFPSNAAFVLIYCISLIFNELLWVKERL